MKRRSLNTRLYLMYLIALAPLIIFGLYKNGIELYNRGVVDFIGLLQPFVILLCGVFGALLGGVLREWKRDVKFGLEMLDKIKCDIVEAVLLTAILPISSNALIVLGVTFAFSLFLSKLKLNRIALMYIVVEGINVLLGLNNFNNAYESSTVLNYNGFDLFFGSGSGGIFSTNVLLITLGVIFLSFNKLYKKEMVYSSLFTFLILGSIPKMISGQYTEIFPYIFGHNVLFILVFIAPNLYSSSYTIKGQITSGILIGIITFVLSFWTPYTAAILAVSITSILKGVLDRIFVVK